MYEIQIHFRGSWVTLATGFKSQDDAEWATAVWKQANRCLGDPFRAVPSVPLTAHEKVAH